MPGCRRGRSLYFRIEHAKCAMGSRFSFCRELRFSLFLCQRSCISTIPTELGKLPPTAGGSLHLDENDPACFVHALLLIISPNHPLCRAAKALASIKSIGGIPGPCGSA